MTWIKSVAPARLAAYFVCGLCLAFSLVVPADHAAGATLYHVVPLATIPGGQPSLARAINNSGEAVGQIFPLYNAAACALWKSPSSVQELADWYSYGYAINDSGMVGGDGGSGATVWSSSGVPQVLPKITGVSYGSLVTGLNNSGVAAGLATNGNNRTDAFRWSSGGGMQDLGIGMGEAINSAGTVAGQGPNGEVCIWNSSGTLIDLAPSAGPQQYGTAYAINSNNEVVGQAHQSAKGEGFNGAFSWTSATGLVNLGTLFGTYGDEATGVNDSGQIVGFGLFQQFQGYPAVDEPWLWTSASGLVNLNSLLDSSSKSWTVQNAGAINNSGEIAGYGVGPSGIQQALLLIPVPEPSAGLLAVIGVCGLCLIKTHARFGSR